MVVVILTVAVVAASPPAAFVVASVPPFSGQVALPSNLISATKDVGERSSAD